MTEQVDNYINITVKTDKTADRALINKDLRIPNKLTVKQTLTQLIDALGAESVTLRPDDRNMIRVVNKGLLLSDDDILDDFAIASGDVIFPIEEHTLTISSGKMIPEKYIATERTEITVPGESRLLKLNLGAPPATSPPHP